MTKDEQQMADRLRLAIEAQEEQDKYNDLFDFFLQEHGIMLTVGEMDDIIREVQEFIKKYNKEVPNG